jgi:pSer/pThr/pTyr-binding forkhead associated (FHA) protein/DNA-directed RNA polymerase subunit RPC12/RpoP
MEPLISGTIAGTGSFRCEQCGYVLTLAAEDKLSDCPGCGGRAFARASLFSSPPGDDAPQVEVEERAAWLQEARSGVEDPGEYIVYADGDETVVVALTREWTRIGRSLAANVRFDDPTVSRRHALVVRAADGVRVLDDRSLNGVFVNGTRVEWSALTDGDEILVGRHRLHFVVVAQTPAASQTASATA